MSARGIRNGREREGRAPVARLPSSLIVLNRDIRILSKLANYGPAPFFLPTPCATVARHERQWLPRFVDSLTKVVGIRLIVWRRYGIIGGAEHQTGRSGPSRGTVSFGRA